MNTSNFIMIQRKGGVTIVRKKLETTLEAPLTEHEQIINELFNELNDLKNKNNDASHQRNLNRVENSLTLKAAIEESINWEDLMTKEEKSDIPFTVAKESVRNRIYNKYIKLLK